MKRSAVLFLALILAACSPQPTASPSAPSAPAEPKRSENQVIRIAQTGIPASLSPEISNGTNAFFAAIYDSLVMQGDNFAIVPGVAEKWEYSPSGWRFTLRKDVQFSDGSPLTVDDVVFTVNLIAEKNLPQKTYVPSITGAAAIDASTVEIRTKTPDASLIAGIPWVYILPKAYYEKVGKDQFAVKPIGSGPYEVADYRPSDRAVFRKKASHPFRNVTATELQFQALPDLSAVINGLRTGDIDMTLLVDFSGDQVDSLQQSGVNVLSLPAGSFQIVAPQYENEQRGTPLKEKTVREALNYAIDRQALAQSIYKGKAIPAGQLTNPASPFWLPDVPAWPYDPAKAKQLLAEAGYPNGFTLSIGLSFSPAFVNPQIPLAVQSYFREVGVNTPVDSFEQGAYLDRFRGINGQVRPDMYFLSASDSAGTAASWRGTVDCAAAPGTRHWCNQEFNRLFDLAQAEPDPAKRKDLLQQSHRALLADVPFIYLLVTPIYVTQNSKIQGLRFTTPAVMRVDSIYRVE
jgi:peptide/nickel transport system substrate-binding protein